MEMTRSRATRTGWSGVSDALSHSDMQVSLVLPRKRGRGGQTRGVLELDEEYHPQG